MTTRVAAGGVDARVIAAGPPFSREAVVYVHGNPGSADDWRDLVEATGQIMRSVAVDLPDFGETWAPRDFEHDVPTYAAWLGGAIDALGIERVHLVVHDFGGPIGLAWAASAPERIASLTLIDTGLLPGYRWHGMARIWRTRWLGELFQAITTRVAFRLALGLREPQGLPREFADRMYDHYDSRTRRAVLRLYRATGEPGEVPPEVAKPLRGLDVPVLVIWGEHDAYIPHSFAVRQRELFPSADVHVLASSGHWPFADAAPTVERLIVGFLTPRSRVRKNSGVSQEELSEESRDARGAHAGT